MVRSVSEDGFEGAMWLASNKGFDRGAVNLASDEGCAFAFALEGFIVLALEGGVVLSPVELECSLAGVVSRTSGEEAADGVTILVSRAPDKDLADIVVDGLFSWSSDEEVDAESDGASDGDVDVGSDSTSEEDFDSKSDSTPDEGFDTG